MQAAGRDVQCLTVDSADNNTSGLQQSCTSSVNFSFQAVTGCETHYEGVHIYIYIYIFA